MAGTKRRNRGEEIEDEQRIGGRGKVIQNKVPGRQVRARPQLLYQPRQSIGILFYTC